jgi:hypothetical protein
MVAQNLLSGKREIVAICQYAASISQGRIVQGLRLRRSSVGVADVLTGRGDPFLPVSRVQDFES